MVAIALETEDEVAFIKILFSAICGFMHILLTIVAGRSAMHKRQGVVLLDCRFTAKTVEDCKRLQRALFEQEFIDQLK